MELFSLLEELKNQVLLETNLLVCFCKCFSVFLAEDYVTKLSYTG